MGAGQRESGSLVIERGRHPGCGVVAGVAGLRKPLLRVIRIVRVLVILQVARDASLYGQVVIVVDVALRAGHRGVRPGQRKPDRIVIESSRNPRGRGVALLTGLRKCRRDVMGIGCALEILQMATHAGRGRAFVLFFDVALAALQRGVRARQGVSGRLKMVEIHARPVVHAGMALLAGSGETRGGVCR